MYDDYYYGIPILKQTKEVNPMQQYIEKYGKQIMTMVLDVIMISQHCDGEAFRQALIEKGLITKATKTLTGQYEPYQIWGVQKHVVRVKNGAGIKLVDVTIAEPNLSQLMEVLRDEANTVNK